jgi:hypothetical protein
MVYFEAQPSHSCVGTEEIHEETRNNGCYSQDTNPTPAEHKQDDLFFESTSR